MVGQAHPLLYHVLSLNRHVMGKEEWSRVPARDAIGLLVTPFNRSCSRGWRASLARWAARYELFVTVLELVRVEAQLPYVHGLVGRPVEDRAGLARAFIAKAVFDHSDDPGPDRASTG